MSKRSKRKIQKRSDDGFETRTYEQSVMEIEDADLGEEPRKRTSAAIKYMKDFTVGQGFHSMWTRPS